MNFYLLRHGKTELNGKGLLLGSSDPSLLDLNDSSLVGRASFLKDISLKYIIHSDMKRTRETSSVIEEHLSKNIPTVYDYRLKELNFGNWELKSYDWLYQHEKDLFLKWVDDPFKNAPPQGESLEQLKERLFSFFDEWSTKDIDGSILIVTHGGPIRLLWSTIHQTSFYEKEVLPSSLFCLNWQDKRLKEIKSEV